MNISRFLRGYFSCHDSKGTSIQLNRTFAIFITVNPNLKDRYQLPDTLKSLFRPVSMMVPDSVCIAELSLFSSGFVDAFKLSRKLVAFFQICSQQLSSQHHYDFGMRAIKAVLKAASHLRLSFSGELESAIVLRSIRDVNISKLIPSDFQLFEAVCLDIFPITPDSTLTTLSASSLLNAGYKRLPQFIANELSVMNLQPLPRLVSKIIQIFEMSKLRHGTMIIGKSMTGSFILKLSSLRDLKFNFVIVDCARVGLAILSTDIQEKQLPFALSYVLSTHWSKKEPQKRQ